MTDRQTTGAGAEPSQPLLTLTAASKSFGPVRALHGVSLDLYPGEAHALLGENGAGKSTLVKILAGVHRPDGGELSVAGEPQHFRSPGDAQRAGVAIIYQEPTLFPDLSALGSGPDAGSMRDATSDAPDASVRLQGDGGRVILRRLRRPHPPLLSPRGARRTSIHRSDQSLSITRPR